MDLPRLLDEGPEGGLSRGQDRGGRRSRSTASELVLRKEKGVYTTSFAKAYESKKLGTEVDLSGMTYRVAPREEWRQIFADAWRWYRDFFYDAGMHGRDWKAIRAKYAPWVEEIRTRAQLNWLLSEMVGELSVSHTYIGGGDTGPSATPPAPAVSAGLLGRRPRGRPDGRPLPLRPHLRPDPLLQRDRDASRPPRRGREGGRLPPRHRRAGLCAPGELLPPPAGGQERRGDADRGPRPEGPGAAHLPRQAGEVRPRGPLRPLGHRQRREGARSSRTATSATCT